MSSHWEVVNYFSLKSPRNKKEVLKTWKKENRVIFECGVDGNLILVCTHSTESGRLFDGDWLRDFIYWEEKKGKRVVVSCCYPNQTTRIWQDLKKNFDNNYSTKLNGWRFYPDENGEFDKVYTVEKSQ